MYRKAIISLSVLFFMFGFITCLNDILVPYLKQVFGLDYTQAALIQFCFFAAYGLCSIPASNIVEKIGYQKGMVCGFVLAAFGCLLFYPAVQFNEYGLFLGALFVLASGVVLLQIASNPFVSILGTPETASSRLTMVQAFNSFGTFLAPIFGGHFILNKLNESTSDPTAVKFPYLFLAVILVVLAVLLARQKFPDVASEKSNDEAPWGSAFKDSRLMLGLLGIFAYVGAEVAIGSFLVNYIIEKIPQTEAQASGLVSLYWGGAMVGRFLGIFTLKLFPPGRVLAVHGLLSIGLILVSINSEGAVAVYSMVLVGICNSVMFPTIFTLAISNLKSNLINKGSGLLGTAIIGGAFIPVLTGKIADVHGLRLAFVVPVVCYAYIAFLGLRFSETSTNNVEMLSSH
jgi:MFS transporter, FHS family, L-fucose permease